MTNRRQFILTGTALAALLVRNALDVAHAAQAPHGTVDLSPEQPGRIRVPKNPAAIAAIGNHYRFANDGNFTVAISPHLPPTATYATDARTVVGSDADYAQLIADSLGLKLNLVPIAWADWPLGLTSGKYDAVISNVGVTEQRKEKFDFTTYRQGLHGFYVKTASPIRKIAQPQDIAGLRLITTSGTNQEKIILEWNRQNIAKGLKPVEFQYFDDDAASRIALLSGRADVVFNPNAPLAYDAATTGAIREVGTLNAGWPARADVAIATRKGSGLMDALTVATNGLIANGVYQRSLAHWGIESEALARSESNPPGLPKF
ncbi:polar amino acid transport system substrate-binding protein [Paraburkholderia atlantica]|uniref:ABC transporter substrate-binding protein n=1 Tax=Paraburkholderia atlantica TaxID=2654982 RepID=UPI000360F928|nr:ABC transporter substrate-binding protein [Paraburkholderia atlantica]MPW06919.1 transporter substrate-binding domain-containing protein [Paraburkholderia atlantica]NUY32840.1 ABC transporter substrate-binding protein [Paraburkholderia atlantica]